MKKRNLFAEIAEGFDALAWGFNSTKQTERVGILVGTWFGVIARNRLLAPFVAPDVVPFGAPVSRMLKPLLCACWSFARHPLPENRTSASCSRVQFATFDQPLASMQANIRRTSSLVTMPEVSG